MNNTNGRTAVASPPGGVARAPKPDGAITPMGRQAPVPAQPGAQNRAAQTPLPSTRPAPIGPRPSPVPAPDPPFPRAG
jgi:hypothetical protein